MGGGVNPLEWVVPFVGAAHWAVDQGAKMAGTPLPPAPGSPDAKAESANAKQQDQLNAQRQAAEERRAAEPRPQTARQETASRYRAEQASEKLGGGRKRKASQTLTDPGNLLSGSLAASYGV